MTRAAQVFGAPDCAGHDPGPGHPESPARLAAIEAALAAAEIPVTLAASATLEQLLRCHSRTYLERVRAVARGGGGALDADTTLSAGSWEAILGATGAALAALDHALSTGRHAFAAIRPPGHHALADRAMGFCMVGHVALLAHHALASGRSRVLILDWDVHHGNGTQALVADEPRIRFVSMHQSPWYPGTGAASDRGPHHTCWNIPMAGGQSRATYVDTLWEGIGAATSDWPPDLVLLSAGYDSLAGDPLGDFTLEPADLTTWIERVRTAWPAIPVVGVLEGGYAPARLAAGVLATVRALG